MTEQELSTSIDNATTVDQIDRAIISAQDGEGISSSLSLTSFVRQAIRAAEKREAIGGCKIEAQKAIFYNRATNIMNARTNEELSQNLGAAAADSNITIVDMHYLSALANERQEQEGW